MENFSYINTSGRTITCAPISVDLELKQLDKILSKFGAGLALIPQLSKPFTELTKTELLYEYKDLQAQAESEETVDQLKLGRSAIQAIHANPELAKHFTATSGISLAKKYVHPMQVLKPRYGDEVAIPADLLKIITPQSTVTLVAFLTHDGEFETYMQVSNPTEVSQLTGEALDLGWRFAHTVEELLDSVEPSELRKLTEAIMERLNVLLKENE
jgi:hypothetical protein